MSYTLRGRRVSNDNIAVGLISGIERTVSGDVPPPEKVGGGDRLSVGTPGVFPTANIADNQQVAVVTMLVERRG